jgi:hypothetical protein
MKKSNKILKNAIVLGMVLILAASCGGKSTGNTNDNGNVTGNGNGTTTIKTKTANAKNCNIVFQKSDSPEVTAVKANQARVECKLTEEEVLSLME